MKPTIETSFYFLQIKAGEKRTISTKITDPISNLFLYPLMFFQILLEGFEKSLFVNPQYIDNTDIERKIVFQSSL